MLDTSGTARADTSSSAEPHEAIPVSYRRRLCASENVISTAPSEYSAVEPASATRSDLSGKSSAIPDTSIETTSISSVNPTRSVPATKSATGRPSSAGGIESDMTSSGCEAVPAKKLPAKSCTAEPETSISIGGSSTMRAMRFLPSMRSVRCSSATDIAAVRPSTETRAPPSAVGLRPCASFSVTLLTSTRAPISSSNTTDSVPVPKSMDARDSRGRVVSTTMSLLNEIEPARPGTGRDRPASGFSPPAARMAPPSSDSELAPT